MINQSKLSLLLLLSMTNISLIGMERQYKYLHELLKNQESEEVHKFLEKMPGSEKSNLLNSKKPPLIFSFPILGSKFETLLNLLLLHGADINAEDEKGNTLLFYTAGKLDLDRVHLLLKYSSNPNHINKKQETVLDALINSPQGSKLFIRKEPVDRHSLVEIYTEKIFSLLKEYKALTCKEVEEQYIECPICTVKYHKYQIGFTNCCHNRLCQACFTQVASVTIWNPQLKKYETHKRCPFCRNDKVFFPIK